MFLIIESYALPCHLAFLATRSLCSSLNVRGAVKNERQPNSSLPVIFIFTGCKLQSKTFSTERKQTFFKLNLLPVRLNIHFDWSAFTSMTIKKSNVSFHRKPAPPTKLTSSVWTRSWFVPFSLKPFHIAWTLIMTALKMKLNTAIENASDKYLLSRAILYFKFNEMSVNWTSYLGIPNWMRILYTHDLPPKWIVGFLKSIISWYISTFYSHFSQV